MKNFLLLSTAVIMPAMAYALPSDFPTYTHTNTPIELRFVSHISGFKLASVCFLGNGDCGSLSFGKGDSDYKVDTVQQCKNEGFVNSCSSGYCMDVSCPYNTAYGKCLVENCPANSAVTCTGAVTGKNACGTECKQCCSDTCPAGYSYSENQLTGGSGNGWVKDGKDFCDNCTKGKLYKRKAAPIPAGYTTCSCGGANAFNSGGTYYYSSCNCCSNCSGYNDSASSCSYGYNSCHDNCTGQTRYACKACDNSCSGSLNYVPSCSYGYTKRTTQCGETCYECKATLTTYKHDMQATGFDGSCYQDDRGYWCYDYCVTCTEYINDVVTLVHSYCGRPEGTSYRCFYPTDISSQAACEARKYLQNACQITDTNGRNNFYWSRC